MQIGQPCFFHAEAGDLPALVTRVYDGPAEKPRKQPDGSVSAPLAAYVDLVVLGGDAAARIERSVREGTEAGTCSAAGSATGPAPATRGDLDALADQVTELEAEVKALEAEVKALKAAQVERAIG